MASPLSQNPSLAEVLNWSMDTRVAGIFTAVPGLVMKYYAEEQTADIQPSLKTNIQSSDGSIISEQLPVLPKVPVLFPRGGGFYLSFPIAKNDKVLLVFCDRSIDQYMAQSGGDNVIDPLDIAAHKLNGAVAIPGFYPQAQGLVATNADSSHMMLGGEGDAIKLRFEDAVIKVEEAIASATKSVAIAEELKALWLAFSARYDAHVHPTALGPSGPPVVVGTAALFDDSKIISNKLKLPGNS